MTSTRGERTARLNWPSGEWGGDVFHFGFISVVSLPCSVAQIALELFARSLAQRRRLAAQLSLVKRLNSDKLIADVQYREERSMRSAQVRVAGCKLLRLSIAANGGRRPTRSGLG